MKVSCALSIEDTVLHHTLFSRTISLKSFLIDCRVFAVIVRMHLNVARADVGFITFVLDAVVVSLLAIVLTIAELNRAVV